MKRVDDIVPERGLSIGSLRFQCPYCRRTFERGGKKEGFVKSGATNHVHACREILLFQKGYVMGRWTNKGQQALPFKASDPYHKQVRRAVMSNLARRRRDGREPSMDNVR